MKLRHFYPLIGFVIPTIVVAYGFVIPHSCIAGWNAQTIGFGTTLLGACAAYYYLTSSLGRVAAQAEYSGR
jgi:ABC-type Fe3+ transport system permease subunit